MAMGVPPRLWIPSLYGISIATLVTVANTSSGLDEEIRSLRKSSARVLLPTEAVEVEASWHVNSQADCESACSEATSKNSMLMVVLRCLDSQGVVVDDARCTRERPSHAECKCNVLSGKEARRHFGSMWFVVMAGASALVLVVAAIYCACTALCRRRNRAKATPCGGSGSLLADGDAGADEQCLKQAMQVPTGFSSEDTAEQSTRVGSSDACGSSMFQGSDILQDVLVARLDNSLSGCLDTSVVTVCSISGSSPLDGAVAIVSRGIAWFDVRSNGTSGGVLAVARGRLENLLPGLDRAKKILAAKPSSKKPFIAELERALRSVETLLQQYNDNDSLQNLAKFRNRFSVSMQSVERPYTDLLLDVNGLIIEAASRIVGDSWETDSSQPDVDSTAAPEALQESAIGAADPRCSPPEVSPCIPSGPFSPSNASPTMNVCSPLVDDASRKTSGWGPRQSMDEESSLEVTIATDVAAVAAVPHSAWAATWGQCSIASHQPLSCEAQPTACDVWRGSEEMVD